MTISFENRVAIVTGAGGGLGRAYALELARRGAKVVVNDLGAARDGTGASDAADKVVEEIRGAGGEAMANGGNVADFAQMQEMVARAKEQWGGVHVLINNAGILRDKSFAKMTMEDFELVVKVHLIGSANCTKAAWETMREQNYGRILMTASSTGLFGNFGQANYGAAKSGVVGLMNVLAIEGERKGIRVNSLAPTAATRMTEDLLDEKTLALLAPESISPGALFMVSDDAPTKTILSAGAGVFAIARMEESQGVYIPEGALSPEVVAERWSEISDMTNSVQVPAAFDQTRRFVEKAVAEQPAN